MTSEQVITLDVQELKEIKIMCLCGTSIRLPLPLKNTLPLEQACLTCPRSLWREGSPMIKRIMSLASALDDWATVGDDCVALKFVLKDSKATG